MSEEKVKALLGFANKAGKLALGRSAVYSSHQKDKLCAIVLAKDASVKVEEMMKTLKIEHFYFGTKDSLGQLFGRDKVGVIGLLDHGFTQSIRQALIE